MSVASHPAHRALDRWADFPVDQDPRPLVLVGPLVFPEKGFRTGEAKRAFLRGEISISASVPGEVVDVLRMAGGGNSQDGSSVPPLVLDRARPGETEFATDRGHRVLGAWRFEGPDLLGPIWALDPNIAATRWTPGVQAGPVSPSEPGRLFHRAQVSASDIELRLQFTGGPPEWVEYAIREVFESPQAVTATVQQHDHGPAGPRRAVGYRREVRVRLDNRLARRCPEHC